jgi:hypothetical protein
MLVPKLIVINYPKPTTGANALSAVKKRKRTPTKAEIAQAIADAAERAERGGRGSGIHIAECRFRLDDRQLGTEATEGTEDPPTEQPTDDPPTE